MGTAPRLVLLVTGIAFFGLFMLSCDALHIAETVYGPFAHQAVTPAILAVLCGFGMFASFTGAVS